MPGLAKVTIKRSREVAKNKGQDTSGATTVIKGADPASVSIELRIWDPRTIDDDLSMLSIILGEIDPKVGVKGAALDITHPKAELRGVTAICLESIEGPDAAGEAGGEWVVKIGASEFCPPKKQAARVPDAAAPYVTAVAAAGKNGPPPPPNPNASPSDFGPPGP